MSTTRSSPRLPEMNLQPGDRLRAKEFRTRAETLPEGSKAELIEGIVYMAAAVKLDHGQPHVFLTAWMAQYAFATAGVECSDNVTLQLDEDNELQPDLSLFIHPSSGGQIMISPDGYIAGPPELVGEIAVSSVAIDRGPKRRVYERRGVCEYLLWRVEDRIIEWYALQNGAYTLLPIEDDGVIRSRVYPGLWLDVEAMLRRDGLAVMKSLNVGLATREHEDFVARLRT